MTRRGSIGHRDERRAVSARQQHPRTPASRAARSTLSTVFSTAAALIAEIAERRQQVVAHVAVRRGAPARPAGSAVCGSRSFSSSTSRSAVFLPTPGIRVSRAMSDDSNRAHQLGRLDAGQHRQRDLRADAADARSAARTAPARARVANPNSCSASSRTCVWMRSATRAARLADGVERRERHDDVVADAADVDDRAAARVFRGACRRDARSRRLASRQLRRASRDASSADDEAGARPATALRRAGPAVCA